MDYTSSPLDYEPTFDSAKRKDDAPDYDAEPLDYTPSFKTNENNSSDRYHLAAQEWLSKNPAYAGDLKDRALHGLTAGLGDGAVAGVRAVRDKLVHGGDLGEYYGYEKALMDERLKNARASTGLTGDVVDIAGSLIPSTAAMKGVGLVANAIPLAAKYATPAVANVLGGGLYGGVEAYGDDRNIGAGVATGAGGAVLGEAAGRALGNVASRVLNRTPEAPTTSEIFKKGAALYDQFGASDGIITRKGIEDLDNRITSFLSRPDIAHDATLMPRVEAARKAIDKYVAPTRALAQQEEGSIQSSLDTLNKLRSPTPQPQPVQTALTPQGLQHIRQLVSMASESPRESEQRAGDLLKGQIDNWISNLSADHVAGNIDTDAFKAANKIWATAEKSKKLDDFIKEAKDSASVSGSAKEQQQRMIAKKMLGSPRGMTADEIAAAQRIIDGTKAQNAARWIGKNLGFHSVPSIAAHAGLHSATGGLFTPLNVAVGIGAEAAGYGSAAAAKRGVNNLSRLIRAGGRQSALAPTTSPRSGLLSQARNPLAAIGAPLMYRGLLSE